MIGMKDDKSPARGSRPRPARANSDGEGLRTNKRKNRTGATKPIPSSCPAERKMVGLSARRASAAIIYLSELNICQELMLSVVCERRGWEGQRSPAP